MFELCTLGIKVKKRSMVLLITAKLTFTMSPHGGMTNDAWCQQTSLEKCGAGSHGASWCFNAQPYHLVLGTVMNCAGSPASPVSTSGDYCCKHHEIGCAFNCEAGYDRWEQVRLCPETHILQGNRKELMNPGLRSR